MSYPLVLFMIFLAVGAGAYQASLQQQAGSSSSSSTSVFDNAIAAVAGASTAADHQRVLTSPTSDHQRAVRRNNDSFDDIRSISDHEPDQEPQHEAPYRSRNWKSARVSNRTLIPGRIKNDGSLSSESPRTMNGSMLSLNSQHDHVENQQDESRRLGNLDEESGEQHDGPNPDLRSPVPWERIPSNILVGASTSSTSQAFDPEQVQDDALAVPPATRPVTLMRSGTPPASLMRSGTPGDQWSSEELGVALAQNTFNEDLEAQDRNMVDRRGWRRQLSPAVSQPASENLDIGSDAQTMIETVVKRERKKRSSTRPWNTGLESLSEGSDDDKIERPASFMSSCESCTSLENCPSRDELGPLERPRSRRDKKQKTRASARDRWANWRSRTGTIETRSRVSATNYRSGMPPLPPLDDDEEAVRAAFEPLSDEEKDEGDEYDTDLEEEDDYTLGLAERSVPRESENNSSDWCRPPPATRRPRLMSSYKKGTLVRGTNNSENVVQDAGAWMDAPVPQEMEPVREFPPLSELEERSGNRDHLAIVIGRQQDDDDITSPRSTRGGTASSTSRTVRRGDEQDAGTRSGGDDIERGERPPEHMMTSTRARTNSGERSYAPRRQRRAMTLHRGQYHNSVRPLHGWQRRGQANSNQPRRTEQQQDQETSTSCCVCPCYSFALYAALRRRVGRHAKEEDDDKAVVRAPSCIHFMMNKYYDRKRKRTPYDQKTIWSMSDVPHMRRFLWQRLGAPELIIEKFADNRLDDPYTGPRRGWNAFDDYLTLTHGITVQKTSCCSHMRNFKNWCKECTGLAADCCEECTACMFCLGISDEALFWVGFYIVGLSTLIFICLAVITMPSGPKPEIFN